MTDDQSTPTAPVINVEIGALLTQCRIAALATSVGIEAIQQRGDAIHLRDQLTLLHGLASRVIDALDEAMNALWGALGLHSVNPANDPNNDV
jgi:hypothetical protein